MTATGHLWDLVFRPAELDPGALARAIEEEVGREPLDFRTRLLIRDAVNALIDYWGMGRVTSWLRASTSGSRIEAILKSSDLGEPGFPSLSRRIMEPTKPQEVLEFLRELSTHVTRPAKLVIGGSIALILADHLLRHTEDVDVVDEVPQELREQHEVIDRLTTRYGLRLTHFQSHYLPAGWEQRTRTLGRMGKLDVFIVDEYDVALSKLFSSRERDLDDLRVLVRRLDRQALTQRLQSSTSAFIADPQLRGHAERNWYILYGEALPG